MNAVMFSELLTDIADEYIVSAAKLRRKSVGQMDPSAVTAFPVSPDSQTTEDHTANKTANSTPRWFTAAALAACMLFAFGMGAFLLRGQHDPQTNPESQTDSAVTDIPQDTGTKTEQTVLSFTAPAVSDIPFTEVAADYDAYDGSFSQDEQYRTESCILRSAEQLKGNRIQPVKVYPEDYFKENALIFVSTVFSNTASSKPAVTKMTFRDNTLRIYAKRNNADDEALEWWCTFLEVRKADIAGTDENTVFDLEVTEGNGRKSSIVPEATQKEIISTVPAVTETEDMAAEPPVQTEPAAEPDASAAPANVTTAPPVTGAAETTTQTTTTAVQHNVMLMTSEEEVTREGDRMIGEYKRRLAQLRGELAADAPRITLAEVMEMVSSGMDFRAIKDSLYERYPDPDYIGGSGVTRVEYWLDDSGTDYIELILEQKDLVHITHGSSREDNLFVKLLN